MTDIAITATAIVGMWIVGNALAIAWSLGKNSPGNETSSPRRSLICEAKIETAIPDVNPTMSKGCI